MALALLNNRLDALLGCRWLGIRKLNQEQQRALDREIAAASENATRENFELLNRALSANGAEVQQRSQDRVTVVIGDCSVRFELRGAVLWAFVFGSDLFHVESIECANASYAYNLFLEFERIKREWGSKLLGLVRDHNFGEINDRRFMKGCLKKNEFSIFVEITFRPDAWCKCFVTCSGGSSLMTYSYPVDECEFVFKFQLFQMNIDPQAKALVLEQLYADGAITVETIAENEQYRINNGPWYVTVDFVGTARWENRSLTDTYACISTPDGTQHYIDLSVSSAVDLVSQVKSLIERCPGPESN